MKAAKCMKICRILRKDLPDLDSAIAGLIYDENLRL
jgi:hypothetical protein